MIIRKLTKDDIQNMISAWKEEPSIDLNDIDDSEERLYIFLKKNSEYCLGIFIESQMIACALASDDARRGYIYHFYVDKNHRHKGYGTLLLNAIIEKMRKNQIQKIHINYFVDNIQAAYFWEKKGFVKRNELQMSTFVIKPL